MALREERKEVKKRLCGTKVDHRLPVANEYLLLSGGAREGVLDLNPEDLGDYARGADFDLDFTLLVPALKLHDRNQPVTLDMRQSGPCHSWLSLRLCDPSTLARWSLCCQEEEAGPEQGGASPGEEGEEPPGPASIPSLQPAGSLDGSYFSPLLVADWFWGVVGRAVAELRRSPQRGTPVPERVERNGPLTTLILTAGAAACSTTCCPWYHGGGGHQRLLPAALLRAAGGPPDREWRLAFSRSEVQLKKCVPPWRRPSRPPRRSSRGCSPAPRRAQPLPPAHCSSGPATGCPRLPGRGRARQSPGRLLLGLLDDLAHCVLGKHCPNYFLPQCNMLEHLSDGAALLVARKLAHLRSDPAEHLRAAVDQARQAGQLRREAAGSNGHAPSPGHSPGAGPAPRPPGRPAGPAAPAAGHREPRQVHLRLPQPRRRHAAALPHRRQVLLTRGGDEARNVLRTQCPSSGSGAL
ncbi:hypothetical protein ANANG_G00071950 [Anguilla anguilla]|uniref:Mab-21-like HhH/H2TH-like domain-containing protein n=1 Tax=Anguilla anguilla TaxID=7936 RepID=A0A9D3MQQ9_ANGAN|nr:hypothetical protein ANANG_G00071950 [Anguilla anguilla]